MAEARVERRVVTALFVDLVGSTALTVALGPERLKRGLDRAFGELAGIIAAEGGTVEKYVGDAIHALFGAPVAHADDPQRALRAARACVRWTDRQEQDRVAFAVRIAVETGEAIVDLGAVEGARQQMSVGACVNDEGQSLPRGAGGGGQGGSRGEARRRPAPGAPGAAGPRLHGVERAPGVPPTPGGVKAGARQAVAHSMT